MRVDLLFVTYNRLAFTREAFQAMRRNTDWDLVRQCVILDDGSEDGTWEYLWERRAEIPTLLFLEQRRAGGPVAAFNAFLTDWAKDAEYVAKLDNDTVVPASWLEACVDVLDRQPELDLLGIEPFHGVPDPWVGIARGYDRAAHIGGIGVMRGRVFQAHPLPTPGGDGGRFGFTSWQTTGAGKLVSKGWLFPPLPVFLLDKMPMDPWASLSESYVQRGWQRRWPPYSYDHHTRQWSWWTPVYPEE